MILEFGAVPTAHVGTEEGIFRTPHGAECIIEFVLPNELRGNERARAHCSQQLEQVLSEELAEGQRGRLMYEHTPGSSERRYVLTLFVPETPGTCLMVEAADVRRRVLCSMVRGGFAARAVSQDDYAEIQASFPELGDVHTLTLECGPETTHPQVTAVVQDALDGHRYFYLLDFERQPGRDALTHGACCAYNVSLLLPGATVATVQRAQSALFEMGGALAVILTRGKSRKRLSVEQPFSTQARLSHRGSMYTIVDLIPA